MTTEELLKPRFEVIAEYPYSEYPIGLILIQELTNCFRYKSENKRYTMVLKDIEKYPHLFRKLNWWEKRTEEEMPKKVKSIEFGGVYEIVKWDMKNHIGYIDIEKREVCDLMIFKPEYGYLPVD